MIGKLSKAVSRQLVIALLPCQTLLFSFRSPIAGISHLMSTLMLVCRYWDRGIVSGLDGYRRTSVWALKHRYGCRPGSCMKTPRLIDSPDCVTCAITPAPRKELSKDEGGEVVVCHCLRLWLRSTPQLNVKDVLTYCRARGTPSASRSDKMHWSCRVHLKLGALKVGRYLLS